MKDSSSLAGLSPWVAPGIPKALSELKRRTRFSIVPFTSDALTSPLHQRHRTDTTRARLGRTGEEATSGPQHGGPSAAIQKVSHTRDPSPLTVPLGAQTRRCYAASRIKLHLATGTLSDVLGWGSTHSRSPSVEDGRCSARPTTSSEHHATVVATGLGSPSPMMASAPVVRGVSRANTTSGGVG
jgi:hypothetical protein